MKEILYFTGSWCAPCKTMKPMVLKIASKYNIPVSVYDMDENADKFNTYGIMQLPTVIMAVDGVEYERMVGAQVPYVIEKFVSKY